MGGHLLVVTGFWGAPPPPRLWLHARKQSSHRLDLHLTFPIPFTKQAAAGGRGSRLSLVTSEESSTCRLLLPHSKEGPARVLHIHSYRGKRHHYILWKAGGAHVMSWT